jgi:hypothetical protein
MSAQGATTLMPASFAIPGVPFTQDLDEWDEDSDQDEQPAWTNHAVPVVPPPVPRASARDIINLLNPVSGNASGSGGQ